MKKSVSKLGFTLIELMVVIIVLAILVAIVVVQYNGAQGRARDTDRRADISNIAKGLEQYYDDNGSYPATSGSSSTITSNWYVSNTTNWTSTFSGAMSSILSPFPADPINSGVITTAKQYSYAYFSGTGCGRAAGQWYLLVYAYENSPKEKFSDGDASGCSANEGDAFYTANGASYYRVIR